MKEGIINLFEIEFYADKNGNEPVKKLIEQLQQKSKTSKADRIRVDKIFTYLRVLERKGTRAGLPFVRHIDGDIWEMRPLRDRILFFYWNNNTFVLLHHFVKKTQKIPKREIAQAKRNMQEHLERSGKNGQ